MIIVRLSGGMGNQMFQYALGRSLSIKNNASLGLDADFLLDRTPIPNFTFREYNLEAFNISASIVSKKDIPFLYRHHFSGILMRYGDYIRRKLINTPGKEKRAYSFDSSILTLGPDIYLEGWWQSPKYFSDIREVLIKDFTLKRPSEKINKLVEEISHQNSVCIHIRKGDYVGNKLHGVLDFEYYKKGIEIIAQNKKIDQLYVFDRDDIEWCKQNISFDYPVTYIENDVSMAECVTLMKSCKDFVLANSSLSWWAGWLGGAKDKIVVAPKKWLGDDTIDTQDLIPQEWKRI